MAGLRHSLPLMKSTVFSVSISNDIWFFLSGLFVKLSHCILYCQISCFPSSWALSYIERGGAWSLPEPQNILWRWEHNYLSWGALRKPVTGKAVSGTDQIWSPIYITTYIAGFPSMLGIAGDFHLRHWADPDLINYKADANASSSKCYLSFNACSEEDVSIGSLIHICHFQILSQLENNSPNI